MSNRTSRFRNSMHRQSNCLMCSNLADGKSGTSNIPPHMNCLHPSGTTQSICRIFLCQSLSRTFTSKAEMRIMIWCSELTVAFRLLRRSGMHDLPQGFSLSTEKSLRFRTAVPWLLLQLQHHYFRRNMNSRDVCIILRLINKWMSTPHRNLHNNNTGLSLGSAEWFWP